MKHLSRFAQLFILPLLFLPLLASAHIPSKLNGDKTPSLAPMLSKVTPAVVNIAVQTAPPKKKKNPFSEAPPAPPAQQPRPEFDAVGSGVIFNAQKGLIVTNAHVVQGERIMMVTLKDGRRFRATLVGKDTGFDIAIVKIHAKHLTAIKFGDSDNVKVGDFVAAIGSPFGLTQTVTSGVVSALNRVTPKIEGFQSFIQTDAPINPGNSGGALVNLKGQLVGINTAIITPTNVNIGIGFAIPSNMVKSVIHQLLTYGKVKRGMLGVLAQNLTPELDQALNLKNTTGVIITKVIAGSPAQKAGLKVQDVVVDVDGKSIRSAAQLHNKLGLMRPGTKITLKVLRDHKPINLSATLASPKSMLDPLTIPFLNGMRLQNFKELEPNGTELQGVVIVTANSTSPGAVAGLQQGDVITAVQGKPVSSVQDILSIIAQQQPQQLLIKVNRGDSSMFMVLQPS